MKANGAPKKLYLLSNGLISYCKSTDEDIEYIRKDAFIEKACDAYCKVCGHYAHEKMQDDIDKLKSSIELALREHNNEVNAQACFAVCMLDVACMAYDLIHKTIKQETHCDFYESFADYYPSEAEVRMVDLARALTNDNLYGVTTNSTVKTGTTIVFNRITDYEALTSYAEEIFDKRNL